MFGRSRAKKASQADIVKLCSILACTPETAKTLLKKGKYDLQNAISYYYQAPHLFPDPIPTAPATSKADVKKLDGLFDKYVDENEDKDATTDTGLAQMHKDFGVDMSTKYAFYFAYQLKCKESGIISREEFKEGFSKLGAYDASTIKSKLKSEFSRIDNNQNNFKAMYQWTFKYLLENEQKKTIPKELAAAIWEVVLVDHKPKLPLLSDFCAFIDEAESSDVKSVQKDTWMQVRQFLMECKDTKGFHNDDTWSLAIDAYLEARQSGAEEKKDD